MLAGAFRAPEWWGYPGSIAFGMGYAEGGLRGVGPHGCPLASCGGFQLVARSWLAGVADLPRVAWGLWLLYVVGVSSGVHI